MSKNSDCEKSKESSKENESSSALYRANTGYVVRMLDGSAAFRTSENGFYRDKIERSED